MKKRILALVVIFLIAAHFVYAGPPMFGGGGSSVDLTKPGPIGGTTPDAVTTTVLTVANGAEATNTVTLKAGSSTNTYGTNIRFLANDNSVQSRIYNDPNGGVALAIYGVNQNYTIFRVATTGGVSHGFDNGQSESWSSYQGNGAAGKLNILYLDGATGNIGAGTATPKSTVHSGGSIAGNVNAQTGTSYTLTDTDFLVTFSNASAISVTLLACDATRTGRMHILADLGAGTATVNRAGSDTFVGNASVSATSYAMATGKTSHIVCDGAGHWLLTLY